SKVTSLRKKRFWLGPMRSHRGQQLRRQFCDFSHDTVYYRRSLSAEAPQNGLSRTCSATGSKADAQTHDTQTAKQCGDAREEDPANQSTLLIARGLCPFRGMKRVDQHHATNFVVKLRGISAHNQSAE